jgi:hypothetical protein
MLDVFDDLIDRHSPPNDPARIAVTASDQRFEFFGKAGFLHLLRAIMDISARVRKSSSRTANLTAHWVPSGLLPLRGTNWR